MADTQTPTTPEAQQSGIFQPKPPMQAPKVLSGEQLAKRVAIVLAVILIAAGIAILFRNPFLKPVKKYYKGLEQQSVDAMSEAFPAWLVNAEVDDDTITVHGMCDVILTSAVYAYGTDFDVDYELITRTDVSESRLEQLESGIAVRYETEVEVSKGYTLKLLVTYSAGDHEAEVTEYASVYRINGTWCILDVPGDPNAE